MKTYRKISETKAEVSRQFLVGGNTTEETETEDIVEIHEFSTTPAQVRVELGRTLNLGNFESARIGVSVTVPCYKEELNEAYEYARELVVSKVTEEIEGIKRSKSRPSFKKIEDDIF